MASKANTIKQSLDNLTSEQLQQVADFVAFLQFQAQKREADLDPLESELRTGFSSNRRESTSIGNIQPMFD